MARSAAFTRIRRELFVLVAAIPAGRIVELTALAKAVNVPPRHVAYILSRLAPDEADLLPWHRVVPTDGRFPSPSKISSRQTTQIEALSREGVVLTKDRRIARLDRVRFALSSTHERTIWADELEN